VARIYAGILGPLAMVTLTAHGLMHGRASEAIASAAWLGLVAFAGVGYVLGWIADRTVEDSVRAAIERRLADESNPAGAGGTATS